MVDAFVVFGLALVVFVGSFWGALRAVVHERHNERPMVMDDKIKRLFGIMGLFLMDYLAEQNLMFFTIRGERLLSDSMSTYLNFFIHADLAKSIDA